MANVEWEYTSFKGTSTFFEHIFVHALGCLLEVRRPSMSTYIACLLLLKDVLLRQPPSVSLNKTLTIEPPPSLLTVILDTNPHAWALLKPILPLTAAVAQLLVFLNAHLACNNANRVAVIASHSSRAEFLFPVQFKEDDDVDMSGHTHPSNGRLQADANQYRPFYQLRHTLLTSLRHLYDNTEPADLTATTAVAGALTLALTFINKNLQAASLDRPSQGSSSQSAGLVGQPDFSNNSETSGTQATGPALLSRILILSVSGDLAHQYIPIMNSIFACQRMTIPIDICKISGDPVFLQQASDATHGTYIKLDHPSGLLQYLMMAFLPDQTSRRSLVSANAVGVDFRAACFCHRKVVDTGWVCSICLSSKLTRPLLRLTLVFCSPPKDEICLTCGTLLRLDRPSSRSTDVFQKKKTRKE